MCGNLDKLNDLVLGDILIDKVLSPLHVQVTLSRLLGISETDIKIVSDISGADSVDNIQLLCELSSTKGEFAQLLSLFPKQLSLEKFDGVSLMKQFCRELTCQVLIPDTSLNPFSYVLINKMGEVFLVHLNPERENDNQYVILEIVDRLK